MAVLIELIGNAEFWVALLSVGASIAGAVYWRMKEAERLRLKQDRSRHEGMDRLKEAEDRAKADQPKVNESIKNQDKTRQSTDF